MYHEKSWSHERRRDLRDEKHKTSRALFQQMIMALTTDCVSRPDPTIKMAQTAPSGVNISKRRKFVADGVFYAELNEFFQRELAEEGYSGVEVRVTPTVTDIIIRATHTQEVLGEQGRRIREVDTSSHPFLPV